MAKKKTGAKKGRKRAAVKAKPRKAMACASGMGFSPFGGKHRDKDKKK